MTSAAIGRITALRGDSLTRAALGLDAAVTGVNGIAYLAGASLLDGALGMPAGFLRGVGAFLIVFAACVAYAATREQVNRTAVYAIIALNALWVVDSIALVALGWYDPTTGGSVWTILQAGVVAGFAALQAYAIRRTPVAM
jgi:hypothetical protein